MYRSLTNKFNCYFLQVYRVKKVPHQIIIKVNGSVATFSTCMKRKSVVVTDFDGSSDVVVTHDENIPVKSFKSSLLSTSKVKFPTVIENQNVAQTYS